MTYKMLFISSKNIVPSRSYRYIRDREFPVTRLPPPIYIKFDVSNGIFGHWQAPWSPLRRKISKALSMTYKMLFISSKNIVPSRSYRAFPVTSLPAPLLLLVRFGVSNNTYIYIDLGTSKRPGPLCDGKSLKPSL